MKGAKTDPPELGRLLRDAAAEVGVELSEAQVERFLVFLQELQVWSAKMSLTAIREPQAIILKHFVDSLTALPHVRECASLLDVGSGPGLPGLALKIARPSLRLISVESRRRKVSFQEHLVRTLKLEGVEVIWGRLTPDCGLVPEESVGCAVSRALALADFLAAAAPFVAPGGRLIAMQGKAAAIEPVAPQGLVLAEQVSLRLPVSGEERTLVIFEKH
jgi:16S rRNA (guanine527-N7)-methyltransferase